VDVEFSQASKACKIRKQEYNDDEFASGEEKVSVNTPAWTRSRYKRSLKLHIKKQIDARFSPLHSKNNDDDDNNRDDDKYRRNKNRILVKNINEDEEGRRNISMMSEEYDSDSNKEYESE